MKIYTKTGDMGMTGLIGGKRVAKDNARVQAYGNVDELNTVLGLCRTKITRDQLGEILKRLQRELFVLGADLAAPETGEFNKQSARSEAKFDANLSAKSSELKSKLRRVNKVLVRRLEKDIDTIEASLPPLKNFILPAGNEGACLLHFARTVCRRAERAVVALAANNRGNRKMGAQDKEPREKINPQIIAYLNRLSDLLFVMARLENHLANAKEEKFFFE